MKGGEGSGWHLRRDHIYSDAAGPQGIIRGQRSSAVFVLLRASDHHSHLSPLALSDALHPPPLEQAAPNPCGNLLARGSVNPTVVAEPLDQVRWPKGVLRWIPRPPSTYPCPL